MSSVNTISQDKLIRLIDTPRCPNLVDVRNEEDFAADPRLIPGSVRRPHSRVGDWEPALHGQNVIAICHQGHKLSEGVAAWLRHSGTPAEVLVGGFLAWAEAGLHAVPDAAIQPRDEQGRTVWVTRSRPKVDRLVCPWLIRRFVDPKSVFLFVTPAEVEGVAERFAAVPIDTESAFLSHRCDLCTFDIMLAEFALSCEPLDRLATIVRGADTGRLDLALEAAGLLAISIGLSRAYTNDLAQLDAALRVYDALYRWCRDATDETQDWPPRKSGS